MSIDKENIIIFWDYDSTGLTSASTSVSTYELVKNIRAGLTPFGSIKAFRAYTDWAQLPLRGSNARAELSSSGVALVDCPSEGRKDVSAKVMITDILIHAWDHSPPHTFVVITADRDLAYPVSLLRTRNYRVILICPATTHTSLVAQASVELDWTRVVLGIRGGIVDDDDSLERPSGPKETFPSSGLHRQTASDTGQGTQYVSSLRKADLGYSQDRRSSEPPATETPNRPSRARRNSTLSRPSEPHRFSVFGEFTNGFTTPRPARGTVGPLGDGPLFPCPRSSAGEHFRADSASPTIRYGNLSTPPMPSFIPSTEPFAVSGGLLSSLKGKQKDLQQFEHFDDTVPEETLESPTGIAVSDPIFGSGGESGLPPATTSPLLPSEKSPSSRTSSVLSSPSSVQSDFSLVEPVEPSTAPTSAQSVDKSDGTVKPSTVIRDGYTEDKLSREGALTQEDLDDLFESTAYQTEPAEPLSFPVPEPVRETSEKEPEKVVVSLQSPVHTPTPLSQPRSAPASNNSTPVAKSVEVTVPQASESPSSRINPAPPKPQTPPPTPAPPAIREPPAPPKFSKPPAPPTPTASASTSKAAVTSKTPSKSTSAPTPSLPLSSIPINFRPLVEILRQEQRGERAGGVDKSHLGSVLPKRFPSVYKQAKCSKLKSYITLAVKAGIVKEAYDDYGDQCVALLPKYK